MTNDEIVVVCNRYFREEIKTLPKKGTALLAIYKRLSGCSFSIDKQMATEELYDKIYKLLELSDVD
jgi:hypothetical protein